MKIVLVLLCEFYARNGRGSFFYKNRRGAYAPTTLITLASLIPQELNAEVQIYDEFIEDFHPDKITADLVGISFTTPNARHAYELATIFRDRNITVVLGGYHVTLMPEEALQYADSCVVGFAEKSWPQLLLDFSFNKLKPIYNSDYRAEFQNMRLTRYDLLKKKKYFLPETIEYSRNCSNHCKFCVIADLYGGQVCYRNLDKLESDISFNGYKDIVFIDSNLADDPDQFYKLCDVLRRLKVRWQAAVSFNNVEKEGVIELMAESGCRGVLIGFETVNQNSLISHNKGFNRVDKYTEVINRFHQNKMYVLGTFVFGFDEDEPSVFNATIDFINRSKIDVVYFNTLIPFPGTGLFDSLDKQNRILTKDWSKYDGKHVVFKPAKMSEKELIDGLRKVHKAAYSLSSVAKRTLFTSSFSMVNFVRNIALGIYTLKVLKYDDE